MLSFSVSQLALYFYLKAQSCHFNLKISNLGLTIIGFVSLSLIFSALLTNMAKTRLIQLLVVLYLTVLTATEESFQHTEPPSNRQNHPRLTATNCRSGQFQRQLFCSKMGFRNVPQDFFPRVEELDLSYNYIETLSNASFSPYKRLTDLSLYKNDIRKISIGSFHSLSELVHLDLGSNFLITSITSDMFRNCTKLSFLSFVGDSLATLPGTMLRWLPNLQMLDLYITDIRHINITSCSSEVPKLTIDLRVSKLKAITPDTFRIDCKLHSLDLSFHHLTMIDQHSISSIRSSSLYFGRITMSPDLWGPFFQGIAHSEIKELYLKATYLGRVDPHYFSLLQSKPLKVLDLSCNNLSNITKMGFLNLPLVATLVLVNCSIEDIKPEYFSRMNGLRVLKLSSNKISYINKVGSTWNLNVQKMDFQNNKLGTIYASSLKGLTNLTTLDLRGNAYLSTITITAFTDLISLRNLDLSGCSF